MADPPYLLCQRYEHLDDPKPPSSIWHLLARPPWYAPVIWLKKKEAQNPILDTRIFARPPSVRHAQATPPGFWNVLDWRALVELRIPNIKKLRG